MNGTELERFWRRVDKRGPDECWIWLGGTSKGYGACRVNGKYALAHRVSWSLANGREFPADKQACHTCDNPPCVNPAHIWPGTVRENSLDALKKGRLKLPGRRWPQNGLCQRGHQFVLATVSGQQRNVCRTCEGIRSERHRNKRRTGARP